MEWTLEVVCVPMSDVDRAIGFSQVDAAGEPEEQAGDDAERLGPDPATPSAQPSATAATACGPPTDRQRADHPPADGARTSHRLTARDHPPTDSQRACRPAEHRQDTAGREPPLAPTGDPDRLGAI